MTTMLSFLTTDVGVEASYMKQTLTQAVDASFNLISIDGCESTNDSVFLFSSGLRDASRRELDTAVHDVCADLARQIVLDAEGATKLVRIEVAGATSDAAAADLGRSIAGSALWRAAAHGGDPNWGRIAAALGQRDRDLDLRALEISIGPEKVFSCGEPVGSLESAAKAMEEDCFSVHCVVGAGPGWAEVLSADLSPAYVDLNATGTS